MTYADTLELALPSPTVLGMRIWERVGWLDSSLGAPKAAGSLVQCRRCGGRGWAGAEPPPEWTGNSESGDTVTCNYCDGGGQFAFPLSPEEFARLEAMGDLPSPYDEDSASPEQVRASPRRAWRRFVAA